MRRGPAGGAKRRIRLLLLIPCAALVVSTVVSSFFVASHLHAGGPRGPGHPLDAPAGPAYARASGDEGPRSGGDGELGESADAAADEGTADGGAAEEEPRVAAESATAQQLGMGGSLVSGDGFGLTIITQTTPDRLHFLREMADRWAPHPLVATVYLPLGSSAEAVEAAARLNGSRPHLQLVLRAQRERGEAYPINELRNLAIAAAHTSHFLTLDVDLWPSEGLHAAFTRQSAALLANKRSALVVPAFAFYATKHAAEADEAFPRKASELPRSMAQLGHCVQRGNCTTFYARSSPETHSSTNYPKWWNWTDVRRTFGIACMRSTRYEPYVIVPRLPSTPRYHEGFDGYGKNKIEFVIHLRYTGFRFDVLPFAFVTHMQHSKSELKEQWEDGATHHREKMDALFLQFAESLRASNKKMKKMPDCSASRAAAKGRSRKAR